MYSTVHSKRQSIHKSHFFMTQLPNSVGEGLAAVAGEEEAEYDDRPRKKARAQNASNTMAQAPPMNMMQQSMAVPQLGQPQMAQRQMAQSQMQLQQHQQALSQLKQTNEKRLGMDQQSFAFNNNASSHDVLQDFDFDSFLNNDSPYAFNFDEPDDVNKPKSPMEKKQLLLHLLSTEILFNTRFHGDFTCTRSEFQSWSPTLPHSTIQSVLSFFGVSQKWLGFFTTFLEAPLKFIEDGPGAEIRTRKRGVPGAHALSSMCGEVVLFVLDYTVNQNTNGAQLYRMHDDFWLWSSSQDTVVKGWESVTAFTDIMGVTLNVGKTGTVRIRRNQTMATDIHPSLPEGEIRWGFLILDPATGHFIIDQHMVDKHIDELQRQLQDKKSVFSWIQAWNTYAGTFFKSNFGKPANCFGRKHVDMILETMTRIQTRIFGESNIVEYLKSTIEAKFGVTNIPDGYLYFPTSLGGLELQNPFIGTIQVRSSVCENPNTLLDKFLENEAEAYSKAEKYFKAGHVQRYNNKEPKYKPAEKVFMSYEEFGRYREEYQATWPGNLMAVYDELLRRPEEASVDTGRGSADVHLEMLRSNMELQGGYLRWVGVLYGREMVERFGGLNVVDKGLLPVGMVNLFRSGRIQWQG